MKISKLLCTKRPKNETVFGSSSTSTRRARPSLAGSESMAIDAEAPWPRPVATEDSSGRRWRREGLVALAVLATASIVLASSMLGHSGARGSAAELMGMGAVGGASSYMLSSMAQQQQGETGEYYYPPGQQQPAMDFAEPVQQQELVGMQPVPCSQSLAGCGSEAAEMANPAGAPSYNSGEGMTYMPSTQSGVSDSDQSPEISQAFLDEEAKAKKHMKKLAALLKKSAKENDALDFKVFLYFVQARLQTHLHARALCKGVNVH